jgi:hypothetical protein
MKLFSFFKLIKNFDRFALPISLTHKGREEYKSSLGGLLSIIAYLIILINAWLLGMDIYKKENPIVIVSEENVTPMNISLVPDDFFLAFYFSDENNNIFEDETIMSLRAVFFSNYIFENGSQAYNEYEVELVSCDKIYVKENSLVEYSFLTKLKCIKERSILLGGSWSEPYIYGLNLKVFYCKNDTISSNCKPMEQIEEIIRTQYINIYYQSLQVNAKNYNNPFKKVSALSYFLLETSFHKQLNFYFQKTNILSDSGIIFPDFIQTHSQIGFLNVDIDVSLSKDSQIILIEIYFSHNIKYYNRSYIKIQTIFANLGGIINILFLLGKLTIISLMRKKYKLKLINTFFQTENLKLEKVNNDTTQFSKEKENQSSIRPTNILCLKDNSNRDIDNYLRSSKTQKLKFTKIEILKSLFHFNKCRINDKDLMFNQGLKYLTNFTDLISVVKQIGELLKIKNLLFNENQLIALDFFSRMSFKGGQINHALESINTMKIQKGEIKDRLLKTIKYFNINKKMLTDLDKKIFQNLEEEIQKFIGYSSTLLK